MMKYVLAVESVIGTGLLLFALGCGSKATLVNDPDPTKTAQKKMEAFKRIADEVARDPNAIAVAGALEEYTILPFDAQNSPKEAEEILQIYKQRIEGKGGKYAKDIENVIAAVRAGLKRATKG